MRLSVFVGCFAVVASCNRNTVPPETSGDRPSASAVSSEDADRKAIAKLEADARAIAKAEGCAASGDCRAAPIGVRGCGGPRDFILYCATSTDSASLARTIALADSAEAAFNAKYQVMSTCEMRMPPALDAAGGKCAAK